jgi:hypothetical protein
MLLRDDDDMPSSSSAEFLTRADHGKSEQRERNAASKGDLLALQRAMLRGQVKPDASAVQVAKQQKDEAAKEGEDRIKTDAENAKPPATKTLQQRIDEKLEEADESDTADTLIDKAKQQQEVKKQASQEYQQDMG